MSIESSLTLYDCLDSNNAIMCSNQTRVKYLLPIYLFLFVANIIPSSQPIALAVKNQSREKKCLGN